MAKRVLVVSGREGVAPALQMQIELWGDALEFALAASGNEALWEIRGSPYDMVLAPWQLPEMTGMEFAEVVQALSPATKVVLVAVPLTPAVQSQAEALRIYALLSETSPQEIAAVISRALGVAIPRPRPTPPPPPQEAPPQVAPPKARPTPAPPPARPAPAATTPPAPPAPPAPERPAPPPPKVKVALTPPQQEAVRRALRDLLASIGPQVALLASTGGEPLVVEGTPGDLPIPALAACAAAAFAGTADLENLLKDDNLAGLLTFAGARFDLYAFTVTPSTILLFLFDRRVVESKLGSVWLYTRKVVEELRSRLS